MLLGNNISQLFIFLLLWSSSWVESWVFICNSGLVRTSDIFYCRNCDVYCNKTSQHISMLLHMKQGIEAQARINLSVVQLINRRYVCQFTRQSTICIRLPTGSAGFVPAEHFRLRPVKDVGTLKEDCTHQQHTVWI